ncbi:MAG: hypothetical protein MMC33_000321, partial [Icmadophila ericetorum]|nr:hypothetical protein [Icmadophila ericetorum]
FWSYELSKRIVGMENESERHQAALKILLCGGIAGVISWASIYPLDMIKTRIQAAQGVDLETNKIIRRSAWTIARDAYRQEGAGIFFRGLGVCSIRAFIVNSVQWAVYEWTIDALTTPRISRRETLQL